MMERHLSRLRAALLQGQLLVRLVPLWAWVLGGLLVADAILLGVFLPAARGELQNVSAQAEAARLNSRTDKLVRESSAEERSSMNLERFRAVLGDNRHSEQALNTLFVLARDLELALPQGQYRMSCEEGGEYCRQRVQLPLKGSYAAVRAFVEQALHAIPFAAVDELSFKRESITEVEVDARVTLSLYFARPRVAASALPEAPQ